MHVPLTDPIMNLNPSIAVIGSSGRLLDTMYGEQIDTYAEVVRFNRAPVENWEKHVGSKTTVRVLNQPTFTSAPLKRWKDDINFVKKLKNQNLLVDRLARAYVKQRNKYCDPSNNVNILERGLAVHAMRKKLGVITTNPTIGFTFVTILIMAGFKPHLYGFDIEAGLSRTHYWHPRPPTSLFHNINNEMKQIAKWGKEDKVVINK